jgi:hypothetical protein
MRTDDGGRGKSCRPSINKPACESASKFDPFRRPTVTPALLHVLIRNQALIRTRDGSDFRADRGPNGAPIHNAHCKNLAELFDASISARLTIGRESPVVRRRADLIVLPRRWVLERTEVVPIGRTDWRLASSRFSTGCMPDDVTPSFPPAGIRAGRFCCAGALGSQLGVERGQTAVPIHTRVRARMLHDLRVACPR